MKSVGRSRMYPVPKMPLGLVELMEGLAKEVLKSNPTDVYTFCAQHMQRLLEIRDGPSLKRVMTLEQKIAIASEKVKERSARRREEYDKNMQMYMQAACDSEKYEHLSIDNNYVDAEKYIKGKIVQIPEKDFSGDVEHEIIANVEETALSSESVNYSEIETKATSERKDSVAVELLNPLKQEMSNTNNYVDYPQKNAIHTTDDNETVEDNKKIIREIEGKVFENYHINNDVERDFQDSDCVDKVNTLSSYEENCFKFSVKTGADIENKCSVKTLVENEGHLECETKTDKYDDQENSENVINKIEDNFNNSKEINDTSITIADQEHANEFNETCYTKIQDSDNDKTLDIDSNTFSSSIETEEDRNSDNHNDLKNHISVNFSEQQLDNRSMSASSPQHEEDILKARYCELQSHVNNSSMDLETAAITIQKVFRSFLFRNKTLSSDDATNVDINLLIDDKPNKDDNDISSINVHKDRRTLGLSRMDTVLQTVNEEKSLSQSTDDSSTLSSAATIIQAHVRGFLVRNKFNLNKNSSTTSGVDSDGMSLTSIEGENDDRKNKTVLNIHIVPESGNYLSRDESLLTSIDLSLDGSPPCSTNLHPLGYDRSERRKQLKREDAIQSISPPTYNSAKLSDDVDSVKEVLINENNKIEDSGEIGNNKNQSESKESVFTIHELNDINISTVADNLDTAIETQSLGFIESPVKYLTERPHSLPEKNSDELDVITPFTPVGEKLSSDFKNDNLIHSGEFHEVVLPTKLSRSDASVVRGE